MKKLWMNLDKLRSLKELSMDTQAHNWVKLTKLLELSIFLIRTIVRHEIISRKHCSYLNRKDLSNFWKKSNKNLNCFNQVVNLIRCSMKAHLMLHKCSVMKKTTKITLAMLHLQKLWILVVKLARKLSRKSHQPKAQEAAWDKEKYSITTWTRTDNFNILFL